VADAALGVAVDVDIDADAVPAMTPAVKAVARALMARTLPLRAKGVRL
jgi:hypothetical protein